MSYKRRPGAKIRKPSPMSGKGQGARFIHENVNYQGEDCLTFPLVRHSNGYALVGIAGKSYWAHRYMCELVNGPPPSPDHEAAHSCGRGKFGCIDPRHLSWKTNAENSLDCKEHGTHARNRHGPGGRLTPQQVIDIRAMKGLKRQADIAAMFNISEPTVRDIFLGRSHRPNPKLRGFTKEDDAMLMGSGAAGVTLEDLAGRMGRTAKSLASRRYRLNRRLGNGRTARKEHASDRTP